MSSQSERSIISSKCTVFHGDSSCSVPRHATPLEWNRKHEATPPHFKPRASSPDKYMNSSVSVIIYQDGISGIISCNLASSQNKRRERTLCTHPVAGPGSSTCVLIHYIINCNKTMEISLPSLGCHVSYLTN
jgi:hypothetical protein